MVIGCLSFYGPTSIYQKDCITAKCTGSSFLPSNRSFEQWQDFRLSRTLNVQEVTIHNGLSKFNFYLGAECLLVDYGLFTQDFLTHRYNNKYWSYPLVYALSSLGLRLGAQASDVKDADSLTRCAHEMLSISCLQTPHVTVVQSLFSLALVELGAANHTSGWILSGEPHGVDQYYGQLTKFF